MKKFIKDYISTVVFIYNTLLCWTVCGDKELRKMLWQLLMYTIKYGYSE